MPYEILPFRRYPYHFDGIVGHNTSGITYEITSYADELAKAQLNSNEGTYYQMSTFNNYSTWRCVVWLFFPEKINLKGIYSKHLSAGNDYSSADYPPQIHVSPDTTNGLDGTWVEPIWGSKGKITDVDTRDSDQWRRGVHPCTYTEPIKAVRLHYYMDAGGGGAYSYLRVHNIHIYGYKADGETPDDLIFLKNDGVTEFDALWDWGDREQGTTQSDSFHIKNTSATATASGVILNINDASNAPPNERFAWSEDNATWVTTNINVGDLAPGATYGPIYIKHTVPEGGQPGSELGPDAVLIDLDVTEWV